MLFFKTTLNDLYLHITNNLFSSHFEETYQDFLIAKKMMYSIDKKDVTSTINLMDMVAGILERDRVDPENKISTHERNLLRAHILLMGISLLNDSELIIDPPDIKRRIQLRILNNVIKSGGLYWASSILVPTVDIFLSADWIGQVLLSTPPETELEYMSMLVQIPWKSIDSSVNTQQIKKILKSLDEIVKKTAPLNYVSLLTLIGKICAFICHIFPEFVVAVVDMLMNSRQPTRLANIPNLCLFSWHYLDGNSTLNLYSLLYMKGAKTTREYATLSFDEKVTHRRWFTDLITTNLPFIEMIYKHDVKLQHANQNLSFPIIRSFVEIALHYNEIPEQDFDLPKLILEELVYFELKDITQDVVLKKLSEELTYAIESILKEIPRLYSVLIIESSESSDNSRLESLIDFSNLVADSTLINWLARIISKKTVIASKSPAELVKSFFTSKSPSNRDVKSRIPLALKVFDSISWKRCDKATVFIAILIVLGSTRKIPNLWRLNTLSRMVKQNVFKFDSDIIEALFSIDRPDLILTFVKVSASANVIASYNRGKPELKSSSGQPYNFKWFLHNLSLYTVELSSSSSSNIEDFAMYAVPIFEQAKKIFKAYCGQSYSESFLVLGNFVDALNKQFGSMSSFCIDYMKSTLSTQAKDLKVWFKFWINLLYPRLIHAVKFEASYQNWSDYPLELLINACHINNFKSSVTFDDFYVDIKQIEHLIEKDYLWILFQILKVSSPSISPDTPIEKEHKEERQSALWLAKEAASLVQDPIFAALLWERFFWLYFNEASKVSDYVVVSDSTKSSLTKLFLKISHSLDKDNDVVYSLLYRNFSSWEPKLIFSSGKPNLMTPNNSQCFILFSDTFKAQFPVNSLKADFLDNDDDDDDHFQYKKVDNTQQMYNLIIRMLPSRYRPNNQILDDEIERYEEYLRDVESLLENLRFEPRTFSIELENIFSKHDQLSGELKELDIEHTSLLQRLWKNETISSSMNLACGSLCRGPASLTIQSFKIVPGPPSVNEDISENRATFHAKFFELFACARSLARVLSLLYDVAVSILEMEDPDSSEKLATSLFYDILPLVEYTQSRSFKLFQQELVCVLKMIGEKYIEEWEELVKQSSI